VLNAIKQVPEVCTIHCATANQVEVIVAETQLGRGVVGVMDGHPPLGVESPADEADRKVFLRSFGYKL
jgi:adenosine/AMP kinase